MSHSDLKCDDKSHFFCLRISGNAASDKNIKDNVCAQIEKNFAKAKWKVSLFYLWLISFSDWESEIRYAQ